MQLDTYPYKILFVCVCVFGNLGCADTWRVMLTSIIRLDKEIPLPCILKHYPHIWPHLNQKAIKRALRVSRIKDLLNIKNGAKILAPVTAIGGKTLR